MPDESDESTEDEDLKAIKAELDAERAKAKKQEHSEHSSNDSSAESDSEMDALKAELEAERKRAVTGPKPVVPSSSAGVRPSFGGPSAGVSREDEKLDDFKAQLEAERLKYGIPKPPVQSAVIASNVGSVAKAEAVSKPVVSSSAAAPSAVARPVVPSVPAWTPQVSAASSPVAGAASMPARTASVVPSSVSPSSGGPADSSRKPVSKESADAELSELEAELEAERKRAVTGPKPVVPSSSAGVRPSFGGPSAGVSREDEKLDDFKAQLEAERLKYGIPKPPVQSAVIASNVGSVAKAEAVSKPVVSSSAAVPSAVARPVVPSVPARAPQVSAARTVPVVASSGTTPPKAQVASVKKPTAAVMADDDLADFEAELEAERKQAKTGSEPVQKVASHDTRPAVQSPPIDRHSVVATSPASPNQPYTKQESTKKTSAETQEDELSEFEAELEAERQKHRVTSQPRDTEKPKAPLTWSAKPAKVNDDGIAKDMKPLPQKKTVRPTLDSLAEEKHDDEFLPAAPSQEKKKQVVKKTSPILQIIALLVVAALVVAGYLLLQRPTEVVKIQCWDGSLVANVSDCRSTTTTTSSTTITFPPTTAPTLLISTSTTTLAPVCSNNSMCLKPIPLMPFCDDRYVKTPDVKYTCIHPGTQDSYCQSLASTPRLLQTCEDNQYCWMGVCYPKTCRNKMRDFDTGEEKIDCGGPCRACNSSDAICKTNSDCGKDVCGTPYCNLAMNPTHNCTRYFCENTGSPSARCMSQKIVSVINICSRGLKCIEGQDDCMPGKGEATCHNCIQDQGEEGPDCGGPCRQCAWRPFNYDTINVTVSSKINYQGYIFKLDNVLKDINCTIGGMVRVTDPYGFSKAIKITRYDYAEFYDVTFGMLSVDTNSQKLWITKKIPL